MTQKLNQIKQFINEEIKNHLMEDFFGVTSASKQFKITKQKLDEVKHYLGVVSSIFSKIELEYSQTGKFSPPLVEECLVYSKQLKDFAVAYEKSLRDLSSKVEETE